MALGKDTATLPYHNMRREFCTLVLSFKDFFLPSFLCMHAYIKSGGFIGGKEPWPLKKLSFCHIKGDMSIWTLHNLKLTHVFIVEVSCY